MSHRQTPSGPGSLSSNLGQARRLLSGANPAQHIRRLFERRQSAAPQVVADDAPTRDARRSNQRLLADELAREAAVLASHPTSMTIDPVTACNLRCPFCPTGGGYTGLARDVLTPELFERIIGHLRAELLDEVVLYNWGEPFLNQHIFDYIRFFSSQGTRTEISTNFSAADYDERFLEKIVNSGLTRLLVSVDGASQQTYEKYRVRGNHQRVVANMRRLAEVKRTLDSALPQVSYKMLLNRFNQHEVDQAREIAASCDAEFVLNERFWCPDELRDEWIATSVLESHQAAIPQGFSSEPEETISTFCRQLWDSVIVNANGGVFPCCLLFHNEDMVGNLAEQDIDEIRNGERLVYLRRWVTDAAAPAPDFPNHCVGCPSRWCSVKR